MGGQYHGSNTMKTVADLRAVADQKLLSGAYAEALGMYCALLELQPANLDVRLRTADTLLALGQVQRAAVTYTALARHAATSGHPLHALVALKILSTLVPQFDVLLRGFAQTYAAASPRLGRGARVAPPDPGQPLPADMQVVAPSALDELCVRAEALASNFDNAGLHYPEKLAPIPLFSLLPEQDFAAVLGAVRLLRSQPGVAIITEGDPGHSFFVLARGRIRVTKKAADGSEVQLATLHAGSIFGEMALLSNSPRTATVSTEIDCDLLEFDRDALAAASSTVSSIATALSSFTQERLVNNLLSTAPLFRPLDDSQRLQLMRRFVPYDADAGTHLIVQGQPGRGLFMVLRGEVEVSRTEGGATSRLAALGPGELFGEISLLNDAPTTATVTATQKSTLLFLSRDYFQRLVEAVPEIRAYVEQVGEERMMDLRLSQALGMETHAEDDEIEILI